MQQHRVDIDRLRELIDSFPRARTVVIGDIIVDHYVWGKVGRISPEAPVPVVEVEKERRRLGGAANVAHNIRHLGGEVDIVGVVGRDEPGEWLRERLAEREISDQGLLALPGRPTTIKTRVIAHSQQVVRFDREDKARLTPKSSLAVEETLEGLLAPGMVVVVSDYGKGVVAKSLLEFLRKKKEEKDLTVCVDPKSMDFKLYRGLSLVTPNQHEAELASHVDIKDERTLKKAGQKLLSILDSEALLVTRGEAGMSLFRADGKIRHIPTMTREVYDVTGAGDTVLACLALALSVGASYLEAAYLANLAAGVVVGKVGTATVEKEELLDSLKEVLPYVENDRE